MHPLEISLEDDINGLITNFSVGFRVHGLLQISASFFNFDFIGLAKCCFLSKSGGKISISNKKKSQINQIKSSLRDASEKQKYQRTHKETDIWIGSALSSQPSTITVLYTHAYYAHTSHGSNTPSYEVSEEDQGMMKQLHVLYKTPCF